MMFYGNDLYSFDGIYLGEKENRLIIQTSDQSREVLIPTSYIHSKPEKVNKIQSIMIEKWFLKRERLIPLTE